MADLAFDELVRREISSEEMERNLAYLCSFDRTSGTEGEYRAVTYVVEQLEHLGVPVEVHEFDAYLSYPRSASLEVLMPEAKVMAAKTRSFSGSTPPSGAEGEIVYVPGGSDMFRDYETASRLESAQLKGKIVLSEGGGRENMIAAQKLGAVGYIHMWPSDEEYLHEGIVSPVWGTPTRQTIGRLPQLPVVTVTHASGEWLRAQAQAGPVKVRLRTEVETGWRKLRLPVADIPGRTPDFVLAGGHIDSWHLGATDNATGNVCCLELARVFWKYRELLERGVRIAWWPGHSTGRYAGSTWYADHAWQDLHDHCVAYVNIDSPGPLGATDYSLITAMSENARFACGLVEELTGQKVDWERPSRAGDQSFWGPGVTSIFMLLSNRPEGQRAAVGGSGMGWWWHTEHDTLDKVDPQVLLLDTKIHATAIARLATLPVLPFRLGDLADELRALLQDQCRKAAGHLDLDPLSQAGEALASAAHAFDAAAGRVASSATTPGSRADTAGARSGAGSGVAFSDREMVNRTLMEVMRLLVPVNYTASGPFDHDAAVPLKPIPGLQGAADLAHRAGDPSYGFVRTELVRQANRVLHALRRSTAVIESALHSFPARA